MTRVAAKTALVSPMPHRLLRWLAACLVVSGLAAGYVAYWYTTPAGGDETRVVVDIPPGAGVPAIARLLRRSGRISSERLFAVCTRLDGRGRRLRAGEYAIAGNLSPRAVADVLIEGRVLLHPVTLVEGWTVAETLRSLNGQEALRADLPPAALTGGAELLAAIGRPGAVSEGHFFPDTYAVARGTPVSQVLRLAYDRMHELAEATWAGRATDLPLAGVEDALTLASLIDPFGRAAMSHLTEYWTPAEKNVLLPSLSGLLPKGGAGSRGGGLLFRLSRSMV